MPPVVVSATAGVTGVGAGSFGMKLRKSEIVQRVSPWHSFTILASRALVSRKLLHLAASVKAEAEQYVNESELLGITPTSKIGF